MTEQSLYIVYLQSGEIVLTKKRYSSWKQIQHEFDDYVTSLGPWSVTQTVEFIAVEYPQDAPFTRAGIETFVQSAKFTLSSRETGHA